MASKGDFHCHSTASDGVLSPTELIKLAYDQGVRVMALTDHDSTEGIMEARRAVPPDLTLIPGVEMGTDIPGAEVHMLGLFLEPDNPELQEILGKLRDGRLGRGEGIVGKLREMGLKISCPYRSPLLRSPKPLPRSSKSPKSRRHSRRPFNQPRRNPSEHYLRHQRPRKTRSIHLSRCPPKQKPKRNRIFVMRIARVAPLRRTRPCTKPVF